MKALRGLSGLDTRNKPVVNLLIATQLKSNYHTQAPRMHSKMVE